MRNPLRCERLEDRETPAAGNVSVVLSGAQLYVTGDVFDNAVSVQQDANGNIFVFGAFGTAVNGRGMVFVGNGILRDVVVRGGGGNDLIDVAGLFVTGGITVETGNGNDTVQLRNVTAPYLAVYTRGGDDTLMSMNAFASIGLDFQGGDGTDFWVNRNTQTGQWGSIIQFEAFT